MRKITIIGLCMILIILTGCNQEEEDTCVQRVDGICLFCEENFETLNNIEQLDCELAKELIINGEGYQKGMMVRECNIPRFNWVYPYEKSVRDIQEWYKVNCIGNVIFRTIG